MLYPSTTTDSLRCLCQQPYFHVISKVISCTKAMHRHSEESDLRRDLTEQSLILILLSNFWANLHYGPISSIHMETSLNLPARSTYCRWITTLCHIPRLRLRKMPRLWLSATCHSRFCRDHIQRQRHPQKDLKNAHLVLDGFPLWRPLPLDRLLVCTKHMTIVKARRREPVGCISQ